MSGAFGFLLLLVAVVILVCSVVVVDKLRNISGMYTSGYKEGRKAARASFQSDFMESYKKGVANGKILGEQEAYFNINRQLNMNGKSVHMYRALTMKRMSAERRYTALWYMNATAEHLQLARQHKRAGERTNMRIMVELARMCNRMVCAAIHTGRV